LCPNTRNAPFSGDGLTKYIIVEEHAAEALDFFSISRESLGVGYRYSIAELVGIFLCRSDFLLHYAGDCMPAAASDWVSRAVRLMSQDSRIKVCSLNPGADYGGAEKQSTEQTEDFYIGKRFSDQCYLVRAEDFRGRIYNESHPDSTRYPKYGGELFEKRVFSWLRNNRHLGASYKHAYYIHKNWPLPPLARLRIVVCAGNGSEKFPNGCELIETRGSLRTIQQVEKSRKNGLLSGKLRQIA
jgi:hypothetical protein